MKKSYWILIGIIILLIIWGVFSYFNKMIIRYGVNEINDSLKDEIDIIFSNLANEGEFCGGIDKINCTEGFYCEPEMEFPESPGICMKNFE